MAWWVKFRIVHDDGSVCSPVYVASLTCSMAVVSGFLVLLVIGSTFRTVRGYGVFSFSPPSPHSEHVWSFCDRFG